MKNGDLLVIPEYRQEISVVGEIVHPSAHLYNRNLNIEDYIDLSGGVNRRADRKRLYIVKADDLSPCPDDQAGSNSAIIAWNPATP